MEQESGMTDYDCEICKYRDLCESRPHSPCFAQLNEMDEKDNEMEVGIYENVNS